MLHQRVHDFLHQKELLSEKYTKIGNEQYYFEMHGDKKIITQPLYDLAARDGFPPGFFRNSYFDRVTFYCLPDAQDCSESAFNLCSFTVCRINGATFENSTFFNCEFHTCDIVSASFYRAALDNCRFHDCHIKDSSFRYSHMKGCKMIECAMNGIGYGSATLDGCTVITHTAPRNIRGLESAIITKSGAESEEERQNRAALLSALKPPPKARQPPKQAKKRGTR